jgi:hypothetical protein
MIADLEQSVRQTVGSDAVVRKLFLSWMQTQPQPLVSGNARGRDR